MPAGMTQVLSQVVITLSGYLDPKRGELRDAALSLGGLSGLPPALYACILCYAQNDDARLLGGAWLG
jgi:hypothetical protein